MQERLNFIILSLVGIVAIFVIILSPAENSIRSNSIRLSEDVAGEASLRRMQIHPRMPPVYPITSADCLDIDGNNKVDTVDVKLIEKVATGRLSFTGNTCVADSNRDGLVNFQDMNDAIRWSNYDFPITLTPPVPNCAAPCNGPPVYLPSLSCGDIDGNGVLEYRDPWLIAVLSAFFLPVYGNTCAGDADLDGRVYILYDSPNILSYIYGSVSSLTCASPCGSPPPLAVDECSDTIDNDGDTFVDYPADFGCTNPGDDLEYEFECNDNGDNDGDTFVDYPADPQCISSYDDYELL